MGMGHCLSQIVSILLELPFVIIFVMIEKSSFLVQCMATFFRLYT